MQLRRVSRKAHRPAYAGLAHLAPASEAPHEPPAELRERSAAMAQAHALLDVALPPSGDLDDLLSSVGRARGRRIQVIPLDLSRTGVSGLWVATAEADYLVAEKTAGPARSEAIVCHELAHMLLDDEAEVADADVLGWMEGMARQKLSPDLATRVLGRRHGYQREGERQAEVLGSHIALRLAEARRLPRDTVLRRLR